MTNCSSKKLKLLIAIRFSEFWHKDNHFLAYDIDESAIFWRNDIHQVKRYRAKIIRNGRDNVSPGVCNFVKKWLIRQYRTLKKVLLFFWLLSKFSVNWNQSRFVVTVGKADNRRGIISNNYLIEPEAIWSTCPWITLRPWTIELRLTDYLSNRSRCDRLALIIYPKLVMI